MLAYSNTSFQFTPKKVGVLFLATVLLNYLLYLYGNMALLAGLGLTIGSALIYLFAVDFHRFLLLFVFLIPLSIPIEIQSSIISAPSEFVLIALCLISVIKIIALNGLNIKILKHPISIIILLDLSWSIITTIYSSLPVISFKRLILKASYFLIFYYVLAVHFRSVTRVIQTFLAYAIGMIIPILWTLYQHSMFGFKMNVSSMITKPFYPEHTIYGAALAFISTVLIVLFGLKSSHINKKIIGPLLIVFFVALFFSYSRAAWLSFGLSFIIYLVVVFKIRKSFILFGLGLFILIGLFNVQFLLSQFEEKEAISSKGDLTEHVKSLTNLSNDASNAERINRWASAWRMTLEKPVFGFGPGTFQFKYAPFQRIDQLTRISTFSGDKGNAHSEYLTASSEMGIPGLLIFLSLIATVFFYLKRAYIDLNGISRSVIFSIGLGMIGYLFHGFVNSFLDVDKIAILIYGSFALATAFDLNRAN